MFNLHIDFGLKVLLNQPENLETLTAFNRNYDTVKPQFILGYLTHYSNLKLWTLSFWEGDAIVASDVIRTFQVLRKTFFVPNITFRPDSLSQEKMATKLEKAKISVITNDKIYKDLPFQSFQIGKATGRLRIIPAGTPYRSLNFKTTDIVLLQDAYPELSPVAGIITTSFSTPLAHVNLRASAWGIPNACYKKAEHEYANLNNQIVRYEVREDGLTLRLASTLERTTFENTIVKKRFEQLPPINRTTHKIAQLTEIKKQDVVAYGAKAANLGAVVNAKLANVHIPLGFAVPFFYYIEHIKANNLGTVIDAMIADPRFETNAMWRRHRLKKIKQAIIQAPLNSAHAALILLKWQEILNSKSVFVRSSTNAEDLEGFNGAGLYDTIPNVTNGDALEIAVKTVWASIWNERAVLERDYAGINHRDVFAAVLIQLAVDATAAGVLLTTDIWRHEPNTFTINAKWGLGIRVVEGIKIPEQVLYDTSNQGTRIISRSSESTMLVLDPISGIREVAVPTENTILTETRARLLGESVEKIIPVFSRKAPLDIEWVLEGEKIWIVQVRPYVTR